MTDYTLDDGFERKIINVKSIDSARIKAITMAKTHKWGISVIIYKGIRWDTYEDKIKARVGTVHLIVGIGGYSELRWYAYRNGRKGNQYRLNKDGSLGKILPKEI